jgi:hypothetical protein
VRAPRRVGRARDRDELERDYDGIVAYRRSKLAQ